jgi:hypothetical protein
MNAVKYNTEIPLGFSTGQANNFSISVNEMTNFEAGTRVILIDKLNPTVENELTNSRAYNFSASLTVATTDRFSLLFRAPTSPNSLNNTTKLDAQVFVNAANQIVINQNGSIENEGKIYISNTIGQMLFSTQTTGNNTEIQHNFESGIYFVMVEKDGNRIIRKIVI